MAGRRRRPGVIEAPNVAAGSLLRSRVPHVWTGTYEKKGLGIFTPGAERLEVLASEVETGARHGLAVRAHMPTDSLTVLGVWTQPLIGGGWKTNYTNALIGVLGDHNELLEHGDVVMAGDVNCSGQSSPKDFPALWATITDRYGFRSAYHDVTGCSPAAEDHMTLWSRRKERAGSHCDLILLPETWNASSVEVGNYAGWGHADLAVSSDHAPVVAPCTADLHRLQRRTEHSMTGDDQDEEDAQDEESDCEFCDGVDEVQIELAEAEASAEAWTADLWDDHGGDFLGMLSECEYCGSGIYPDEAIAEFEAARLEAQGPPPKIPDGLLDAYARTVVTVTDLRGQELPATEAAEDHGELWVISAHNPYSEIRSDLGNERRHDELVAHLGRNGGRHGWRHYDAAGRAPDGSWRERSVAVQGVSEEEARRLGQMWRQHAVFHVTPGAVDVVESRTGTRTHCATAARPGEDT